MSVVRILLISILVSVSFVGYSQITGSGTQGNIPHFSSSSSISNTNLKFFSTDKRISNETWLNWQFTNEGATSSVRGLLSSNLYWNNTADQWTVGANGWGDFSAILFRNASEGMAFYTYGGNGNNAFTFSNANLASYERMRIRGDGKIGIGTDLPLTTLHVRTKSVLGSNEGNYIGLLTLQTAGGSSGNEVYANDFLYRDANGSDWFTVRLHNGIQIDGSGNIPHGPSGGGANTGTRTYWERDPYNITTAIK